MKTIKPIMPVVAPAALICVGAYVAHVPTKAAPPGESGPILPVTGLRVELVNSQPEFVASLTEGWLYGCDLNGDTLCNGADIQEFVNMRLAEP